MLVDRKKKVVANKAHRFSVQLYFHEGQNHSYSCVLLCNLFVEKLIPTPPPPQFDEKSFFLFHTVDSEILKIPKSKS